MNPPLGGQGGQSNGKNYFLEGGRGANQNSIELYRFLQQLP